MSPRFLPALLCVTTIFFAGCGNAPTESRDTSTPLAEIGHSDATSLGAGDLPLIGQADSEISTPVADTSGVDACDGGDCDATTCGPGATRCDGNQVVRCSADGREAVETSCGEDAICVAGQCVSQCVWQNQKRGYLGCRYLAADLPSSSAHLASKPDPVFAFAFSNPDPQKIATVTITYPDGKQLTVLVQPESVAKHQLPDRQFALSGSGAASFGFLIESNRPIGAVMFNPLEQEQPDGQFAGSSNDASLLLPINALGTDYISVSWRESAQNPSPNFITIIAADDDTTVTVTPKSEVTLPSPMVPIAPGESRSFALQARQVLNLESTADLTGSEINANKKIAVFSGNVCANIPVDGIYCDHIETQLPPTDTWGKTHVVTKFTDRGGEADFFRVVAREDHTTLAFDPPRAGVPMLARGQYYQFSSKTGLVITADKAVLVGQFMASQSETRPGPFGKLCPKQTQPGSCVGDPSLVLPPPLEQWRNDYIFLIPETYEYDFINIAVNKQAQLQLDGQLLSMDEAEPIGSSGFVALTLPIGPGFHRLLSSIPSALVVYGYDYNVSYSYVGGLNFNVIAP